MSRTGWIARCIAGALLLWAQTQVLASPAYQYSGGYGDTARPTDINDVGTIVWTGFCDSHCGSRLGVGGAFVAGFAPWPNDYTRVTDINNNGDLLGSAIKGGGLVPTMWIGGVPYDLSDPTNAGLVFTYDPGPKSLLGFDNQDLLALRVSWTCRRGFFRPTARLARSCRRSTMATAPTSVCPSQPSAESP